MRFSLVVPSLGRAGDLERLLQSLAAQTFREFEVIVVDQSRSNALDGTLAAFSDRLALRHCRSEERGASRARNTGAALASGEIIAWPDDDCFYPPELLETVDALFQAHPNWGGLAGCPIDEEGIVHSRSLPDTMTALSRSNIFQMGVEYSLFLRRDVLKKTGGFDEQFGPGAGTDWWAGEATDYEMRILQSGTPLFYCPAVHIHHPNQIVFDFDAKAEEKRRHYAMGMGAVIRKNGPPHGGFPAWFIAYYLGLYLRAVLWALARGRFRYARTHGMRLQSVWQGWLSYRA